MNVLVACECSGIVREAFRARGHNAWSCDIKPAEDKSIFHLPIDVRRVLDQGWDLMIAHPECTYLSSSGLHWNLKRPGRAQQTEEALAFVRQLMNAPISKIAIENPIGCISTRIRPYDQKIQPWMFGEDASKGTCLWLKGLPKLEPTGLVAPRFVDGKPRWSNQTDSGQNRLGPSEHRAADRARTYPGIARAFAEQWGLSRLPI